MKGFYTLMSSTYLYLFNFLSKLCTFKKRCQSVEYFFTDCICCWSIKEWRFVLIQRVAWDKLVMQFAFSWYTVNISLVTWFFFVYTLAWRLVTWFFLVYTQAFSLLGYFTVYTGKHCITSIYLTTLTEEINGWQKRWEPITHSFATALFTSVSICEDCKALFCICIHFHVWQV